MFTVSSLRGSLRTYRVLVVTALLLSHQVFGTKSLSDGQASGDKEALHNNFGAVISHRPLAKRVLDQEYSQRYSALTCKGNTGCLDGQSQYQTPEFPGKGEEGFRKLARDREDDTVKFPSIWEDASKMTQYKQDPEVHIIRLEQLHTFDPDEDDDYWVAWSFFLSRNYLIQSIQMPTMALYEAYFIPEAGAIIVTNSHNPTHMIEKSGWDHSEHEMA
ncbi:MAG: hypothetical protein Q9209_002174 [Squamulea sp. 1 TL-2023]